MPKKKEKPPQPVLPPWYRSYDKALPPALLALCPDTQCDLCGIVFNGPSISGSHYHGKAHAKKVSQYLEAIPDMKEENKPKRIKLDTDHVAAATPTSLYCEICSLVCTSQVVYDDHMKGKNHASKVRAVEAAANGEFQGQYKCTVCNVFAASQEILASHMEGKTHKKKMNSQGVKEEDLRCELCDVTSTDKDGHERHLGGKRHRDKLEGKEPGKKIKTEKTDVNIEVKMDDTGETKVVDDDEKTDLNCVKMEENVETKVIDYDTTVTTDSNGVKTE